MICPKCGFEQPESPECVRCGIIVSRYKGPVLGGAPAHAEPPPLPPPLPQPPVLPFSESAGAVFGGPAPAPAAAMAVAGGGTLYEGPVPAAAGGGTVYGGTVYGGPGSAPPVATGRQIHGQFEIGKILSESFSVYFSNFIPFVLLTGIALAPLYLVQAYITASPETMALTALSTGLSLVVLGLSAFLCPYIATAAITYGVFQQMRGRDTSVGDCLGRGLSALFPVLLLAIVQGFAILFGAMLCLIPGILWSLWWAVSVPAAIEEKLGVFDAMSRSKILTDGYRGDIFGVLFVVGILNFGATLVLGLLAAKNQTLMLVLSGIKDLLAVGLSATATAVMYYRLRSIKESIDVDQISSVFA